LEEVGDSFSFAVGEDILVQAVAGSRCAGRKISQLPFPLPSTGPTINGLELSQGCVIPPQHDWQAPIATAGCCGLVRIVRESNPTMVEVVLTSICAEASCMGLATLVSMPGLG